MPGISVVIPLYNKAPYIVRAVKSVLAQTAPDFELLIVNDASTDGGEKLLAGISDRRVRLLHRESPGAGGHAARNRGIKEAGADLIAFLDADDEWNPDFLGWMLRLRRTFPLAGAYAAAYEEHLPGGQRAVQRLRAAASAEDGSLLVNYLQASLREELMSPSSVAIPRHVFDEVGLFPEGEKRAGDLDMWLRIALRFSIAYTGYVGTIYHMEAANRIDTDDFYLEERLLIRTGLRALRDNLVPDGLRSDLREYISMFQIKSATEHVLTGRPRAARKILAECETTLFLRQKVQWYLLTYAPRTLSRALWAARRNMARAAG